MRGLRLLLLATVVWAALTMPAAAAGPTVTMEVEAGFAGFARAGRWTPVLVTLRNEGAEFSGALRFDTRSEMGRLNRHEGIYRTPVVVPAGGTKRLQLFMPMTARLSELVLEAGEQRVAAVQPQVSLTADCLVGLLGVEPAGLAALAGRSVGSRQIRLVGLTADTLPAEASVLDSLDAILLDRFAYGEMPAPQQAALQAWVEHGGRLILAGGPESHRLSELSPWVPLQLGSVQSVAIEGVGTAPLAPLETAGTAWQVTRRSGPVPLVSHYRKGGGSVFYLSFDPALEPFASWTGLPDWLEGLLPARNNMVDMGIKESAMFVDMMTLNTRQELPSTRGLVWALAGYALLIGPVHFLVLRGFRRLGLALVTLPLLAAAGAGGAWYYMDHVRTTDVLATAMTVLEGQPGAGSLRAHTTAGFLLAPHTRHEVSVGDALLEPATSSYPVDPQGAGAQAGEPTILSEGRRASIAAGESWSLRSLSTDGWLFVDGTVSGDLVMDASRIKGRLTSRLPFALQDALVVSGGNFERIGDLTPGAAVDLTLALPAFTQTFGGGNQLAETLGRAMAAGGQTLIYEMERRQQMVWAGLNSIAWVRSGDQPMAVLFGWATEPGLVVEVDGRKAPATATTLYVQPLTVGYAAGEVTIPSSLMGARLVEWNGGPPPARALQPGWSMSKGDRVVLEFTVPPELIHRVAGFEFSLPTMDKGREPGGPLTTTIEFLRWTDQTWQTVQGREERAAAPDGPSYVDAGGRVRVKLTATAEERRVLATPGLKVEAKGVRP